MSTKLVVKGTPLTRQDRCDRCNAAAQVRALLLTGDLLFCGHCGREAYKSLEKVAISIEDPFNQLWESRKPAE